MTILSFSQTPFLALLTILTTLIGGLVATLWAIVWTRIKDNEHKINDHETRINVIENDIKHEVLMLTQKIEVLSGRVETLKEYVHDQIHSDNNDKQAVKNLVHRVDELVRSLEKL
jgi:AICAR transformylase/IMP cyclohydrolase PurH